MYKMLTRTLLGMHVKYGLFRMLFMFLACLIFSYAYKASIYSVLEITAKQQLVSQ